MVLLFTRSGKAIFRKTLEDELVEIIINGAVIINMRYADDTVLLTSNFEDTQPHIKKIKLPM